MSNNRYSKNGKKPYQKKGNKKQYNKKVVPSDERESMGTLDASGRDNDPNWYFQSTELASQTAQLSFQNFIGDGHIIGEYALPTAVTFWMNGCPGNSYDISPKSDHVNPDVQDITSDWNGLNLSTIKTFNLLASNSGRVTQYQQCDIGCMILGISSIAEMAETIRRAFGVVMLTNPRNRFVPKYLVDRAMRIDYDDLTSHLPSYRSRFNVLLTRINTIPMLDNIGYIRKARDLYQHVYADSTSSMAQLFLYMPESLWVLDEDTDPTGTVMRTVAPWCDDMETDHIVRVNRGVGTSAPLKMSELLDIFEDMVTKMLTSSTLNIIYADLINLARKIDVPRWTFDLLAENYAVMPEYNRNALLQMHNLDIAGNIGHGSAQIETDNFISYTPQNDVWCDPNTGRLVYNPAFSFTSGYSFRTQTIVDMDTDAPNDIDRIEALRKSIIGSGYQATLNENTYDVFLTLPDHYCGAMSITTNIEEFTKLPTFSNNMFTDDYLTMREMSLISQVDWAPLFYGTDPDSATHEVSAVLGDLNFCTSIEWEYLWRVNRVMYTGLFDFRT